MKSKIFMSLGDHTYTGITTTAIAAAYVSKVRNVQYAP